jgi:hypothetical protein
MATTQTGATPYMSIQNDNKKRLLKTAVSQSLFSFGGVDVFGTRLDALGCPQSNASPSKGYVTRSHLCSILFHGSQAYGDTTCFCSGVFGGLKMAYHASYSFYGPWPLLACSQAVHHNNYMSRMSGTHQEFTVFFLSKPANRSTYYWASLPPKEIGTYIHKGTGHMMN